MSWGGHIKYGLQNLGNFYRVTMLFPLCVFTFFLKKLRGVGVLLLPCTRLCLWCFTKTLRVSVGVTS